MGVKIVLDHNVTDVLAEQSAGKFDAVFIAVGAHLSKRTNIPARDAGKVYDAVALLRKIETGEAPRLGRRVVVYGGGNTAMDAARTAKRLGADEALIIYRRDRAHMPAHEFEADEALAGRRQDQMADLDQSDRRRRSHVERMRIDENGGAADRRDETLKADAVVLAVGQDADSGFCARSPRSSIAMTAPSSSVPI
jgi:NADPH-dependent glutamate synthase beta subunit-like oxidoreductase